ncbi:MAG: radical SAM protein [Candidatus Margulisbacteria bacterium]|nr:radical SAM protein [Candidatus Margulisiibacteriota bacterium]
MKLPFYYMVRYLKRLINNLARSRNIPVGTPSSPEKHYCKEEIPRPPAQIEITNACNLNCIMCNTKQSKRPVGQMSPETFTRILEELSVMGIKTISLHTVGETFMYRDLDTLLEISRKLGFEVWISSNGQFPEHIKKTYYRFPDLIKTFRFSIDSPRKETYEHIRRGASFDRLIESLETVHKINKGKRDYHITVTIDSILSMINIFELADFFRVYTKYCWPHNINFHLINGLTPDPGFFKKDFPFPNIVRKLIPCSMPFQKVNFTYKGNVSLCCRDYDEELVIGNIKESPLSRIWNCKRAEEIRFKHLNPEKLDISPCNKCYGPIPSVSKSVNEYIHHQISKQKRISNEELGNKVVAYLNRIDKDLSPAGQGQDKIAV